MESRASFVFCFIMLDDSAMLSYLIGLLIQAPNLLLAGLSSILTWENWQSLHHKEISQYTAKYTPTLSLSIYCCSAFPRLDLSACDLSSFEEWAKCRLRPAWVKA